MPFILTACGGTSRASPSAMYSVTARFVCIGPLLGISPGGAPFRRSFRDPPPCAPLERRPRFFAISSVAGRQPHGWGMRGRRGTPSAILVALFVVRTCAQDRLHFVCECPLADKTIHAASRVQDGPRRKRFFLAETNCACCF